MTVYRCDKCGKIQEVPFLDKLEITKKTAPGKYEKVCYELCKDCAEEFIHDTFQAVDRAGCPERRT